MTHVNVLNEAAACSAARSKGFYVTFCRAGLFYRLYDGRGIKHHFYFRVHVTNHGGNKLMILNPHKCRLPLFP